MGSNRVKSKFQTYTVVWLTTPSHPRASCPVFSTSHQGCKDFLGVTAHGEAWYRAAACGEFSDLSVVSFSDACSVDIFSKRARCINRYSNNGPHATGMRRRRANIFGDLRISLYTTPSFDVFPSVFENILSSGSKRNENIPFGKILIFWVQRERRTRLDDFWIVGHQNHSAKWETTE